MKNKDEHSLISNRGGWSARQTDPVLRPERTGSATSVLPALRASFVHALPYGNSDAELASLQGTAACGPARTVVWGGPPATVKQEYERLFQQQCKSHNKRWLVRKIIWRT